MNQNSSSFLTYKIIWGALLMVHVILGVVLNLQLSKVDMPPMENPTIIPMLGGIGLMNAILSFLLPKLLLRQQSAQQEVNPSLERLMQKYSAPFVLRLALIESVTLMGFSSAYLSRDINHFYPFFAVGVVLHLLAFPTEEKMKKALGY